MPVYSASPMPLTVNVMLIECLNSNGVVKGMREEQSANAPHVQYNAGNLRYNTLVYKGIKYNFYWNASFFNDPLLFNYFFLNRVASVGVRSTSYPPLFEQTHLVPCAELSGALPGDIRSAQEWSGKMIQPSYFEDF